MQIYKGRAPESDYEQLMALLNDVFFSGDDEADRRDFLTLLPKLYKKQYNPCYNNFVIKEGDSIKASVGMFPVKFMAGGIPLKVAGIGNVAVSKDCRGKGYMIECMNLCIDAMKAEDADFSMLGGQRQRYGYFGYEPAGVSYHFDIGYRSLEHLVGKGAKSGWAAKEVTDFADPVLAEIKAVNTSLALYAVRADEAYLDTMRSWDCKLYAAYDGEQFKGYFSVSRSGGINEFMPKDNADFLKLAMCCLETTGKDSIGFSVSPLNTELTELMAKSCGGSHLGYSEQVNILNYANCIRAYLTAKAQAMPLCDGEFTALIHGIKCDEQIKISVCGNKVDVCPAQGKPDIELEHHEAERFFFSFFSDSRRNAPGFVSQWFPLPLFSYSSDNV